MPVQGDSAKIYRYTRIVERIAAVQNQMRSLRFQLDLLIRFLAANPSFISDVSALTAGDYVLPTANSPTREELLSVLKAILSYATYAGHLTQTDYTNMTGDTSPVPPDQISTGIDAWIRD